ncbi:hypothetical protein OQA88_10756 [Cercophora sp. LCS_1]
MEPTLRFLLGGHESLLGEESAVAALAEKTIREGLDAQRKPDDDEFDELVWTETKLMQTLVDEIVVLLSLLLGLLGDAASEAWERQYECADLREEVSRMRSQLRDSIPLGDGAAQLHKPRSAWDVDCENAARAQDGKIADLRRKVRDLEAELAALFARLKGELAKNWQLTYRCDDMREEVWRLNMQMRNSVSVVDVDYPPWKPKSALERVLERKIVDLEDRIRHPKGRGRSNSM